MLKIEGGENRRVNLPKDPDYFSIDDDIPAAAIDKRGIGRFHDRVGKREFAAEDVHRCIRFREVCARVDADPRGLLEGDAVLDHVPHRKEPLRELAVLVRLERLHQQGKEVGSDHRLLLTDRVKNPQGSGSGLALHH